MFQNKNKKTSNLLHLPINSEKKHQLTFILCTSSPVMKILQLRYVYLLTTVLNGRKKVEFSPSLITSSNLIKGLKTILKAWYTWEKVEQN